MSHNDEANQEGSLMIESMVAASLVVVGLLGLFNLIYNSTVRDSLAIHRLQATYLAAEGIEVIKNISDADVANGNRWDCGPGSSRDSCQPFDSCYLVSYDSNLSNLASSTTGANLFFATSSTGDGVFAPSGNFSMNGLSASKTLFTRKVCVDASSGTYMVVTSTVTWSERGQNESITLSDLLYDWRPRQ